MKQHSVRTYKSAEPLDRADQLAWKIASGGVGRQSQSRPMSSR